MRKPHFIDRREQAASRGPVQLQWNGDLLDVKDYLSERRRLVRACKMATASDPEGGERLKTDEEILANPIVSIKIAGEVRSVGAYDYLCFCWGDGEFSESFWGDGAIEISGRGGRDGIASLYLYPAGEAQLSLPNQTFEDMQPVPRLARAAINLRAYRDNLPAGGEHSDLAANVLRHFEPEAILLLHALAWGDAQLLRDVATAMTTEKKLGAPPKPQKRKPGPRPKEKVANAPKGDDEMLLASLVEQIAAKEWRAPTRNELLDEFNSAITSSEYRERQGKTTRKRPKVSGEWLGEKLYRMGLPWICGDPVGRPPDERE